MQIVYHEIDNEEDMQEALQYLFDEQKDIGIASLLMPENFDSLNGALSNIKLFVEVLNRIAESSNAGRLILPACFAIIDVSCI
jgi:hypothetical protein